MYYLAFSRAKGSHIIEIHERSQFLTIMREQELTSLSPGYETEESLRKGEEIIEPTCKKCGGLISLRYDTKDLLQEKGICFACSIWDERIQTSKESNVAIIEGGYYTIHKDMDKPGWSSGFGGQRFYIKFNDGRVIVTRNAWFGGDIPDRFKDEIPDNAKFISKEEFDSMTLSNA